jgi:hypothetical protein
VYVLDGSEWDGAAEVKVRVFIGDKRRDGPTMNVPDNGRGMEKMNENELVNEEKGP